MCGDDAHQETNETKKRTQSVSCYTHAVVGAQVFVSAFCTCNDEKKKFRLVSSHTRTIFITGRVRLKISPITHKRKATIAGMRQPLAPHSPYMEHTQSPKASLLWTDSVYTSITMGYAYAVTSSVSK